MATFSPAKPLTEEEKMLFPNAPAKEEEQSSEASPEDENHD